MCIYIFPIYGTYTRQIHVELSGMLVMQSTGTAHRCNTHRHKHRQYIPIAICPRAADRNNCPQCATGCVQAICIRIVSQPGGLCGRWFLVPRAVRPILPTPTSHAQGKHQALYQHISSLRAQILLGWLTRHRKI